MKNRKLLTVCIPTYNRCEYVLKTIKNLDSQLKIEDLTSIIEIIISDNNSTDDSEKKIIDYIGDKTYIKYVRNNENLGFGRNIERLSFLAKGDYLWFCGDDDIYSSDIIKSIYIILSESIDLDYLYINYTDKEKEIDNKKNDTLYFKNKMDLFSYILNGPGFLSSSIFKAKLYNSIKVECGNWIHFEKLINFPDFFNSVVLNNKKICVYRPNKNNWFQKKTMCNYIIEIMATIIHCSNISLKIRKTLLQQYTYNFCDSYLKPFIYSKKCKKKDINDIKNKLLSMETENLIAYSNEIKILNRNYLSIVLLRPFYSLGNIFARFIRKTKECFN